MQVRVKSNINRLIQRASSQERLPIPIARVPKRGTTGMHVRGSSRRRRIASRGRSLSLMVGVVLAILVASTVQGLSTPGGGPSKSGAAVTPLPTANAAHGGRVPPAASTGATGTAPRSTTKGGTGGTKHSGGAVTTGGVHSDGVEKGGCESWGTDYVGVTYIHHAALTAPGRTTPRAASSPKRQARSPSTARCTAETYCPDVPSRLRHRDRRLGRLLDGHTAGWRLRLRRRRPRRVPGHRRVHRDNRGHRGRQRMSGYWLVSSLGQVFAYGGAGYYGGSPSTLVATHDYFGE